MKKDLDFLKSTSEDKIFHCSRIMFCIKEGKVVIAPSGIPNSHLELV